MKPHIKARVRECIRECIWKASGCLEGPNGTQYPTTWLDGKNQRLSRLLLGIKRGRKLAKREFACHECDNPKCVNVKHLFIGSQSDNLKDAASKGRTALYLGYNATAEDYRRRHAERLASIEARKAATDTRKGK